jgi:hypothetical protein
MGSPLGLPMASFQLFSGDPGEADRPDRKAVIKVKIPNLPSSLHPEGSVQNFPFYTRFFLSCQLISRFHPILLRSFIEQLLSKTAGISVLGLQNNFTILTKWVSARIPGNLLVLEIFQYYESAS